MQYLAIAREYLAIARGLLAHPLSSLGTIRTTKHGTAFTDAWRVIEQPPTTDRNPLSPLEEYARAHSQGPGIWKWTHYYPIYHRHLQRFVGRAPHILEIGVFSGGSLGMWQEYFGRTCQVYGMDIRKECRAYESAGVKIFIGDQADRSFWRETLQRIPRLDVVIDDGGHESHQQIATLEEVLPALAPGDVYICEDIHGIDNPFASYVSGMARALNHWHGTHGDVHGSLASRFQQAVESIHQYPFLTVIERSAAAVKEFRAPKYGTEWQPFYDASK